MLWIEVIDPMERMRISVSDINHLIETHHGSLMLDPQHSIKSLFEFPDDAFYCAQHIVTCLDRDLVHPRMVLLSDDIDQKEVEKFCRSAADYCNTISISCCKRGIYTSSKTFALLLNEGLTGNYLERHVQVFSLEDEHFLLQVVSCIKDNYSLAGFNVNELASDVLMSRSQLYKKTRKITGRTPGHLIREIRLYRALQLLDTSQEQIAQIAFETGFNSPSYFAKVFEKRFHLLPSDYIGLSHH